MFLGNKVTVQAASGKQTNVMENLYPAEIAWEEIKKWSD